MDDNLEALHDDPTVDDAEKFKVVENAQAIHWLDEDLSEYDRSYVMQLWQTSGKRDVKQHSQRLCVPLLPICLRL